MNKSFTPTLLLVLLLSLIFTGLSGCVDPNYSRPGAYNDPYYDPYDYERDRIESERRDLDRERRRVEDERRRLEEERDRQSRNPVPRIPSRADDHCPSGFSPSEQKCSSEERRHGCQDIRLPSGLGCVRR